MTYALVNCNPGPPPPRHEGNLTENVPWNNAFSLLACPGGMGTGVLTKLDRCRDI